MRRRPKVGPGVAIPGMSRRLRAAIYDHVFDNATHEVGGVLVGTLGDGPMPAVSGSIAALEARGERASVTFTHEAWASIHERLERDFPGRQIVGWYHSHPGFGIFLSSHDLFIHRNFFGDPNQIAYVVDPHAGTEGVFGWRDGDVVVLEEGDAGRPGVADGGLAAAAPPRSSSKRGDQLRYGVLALLAALVVAGLVLLGGGSDDPVPAGTVPGAPTSTAPIAPAPAPAPPVTPPPATTPAAPAPAVPVPEAPVDPA